MRLLDLFLHPRRGGASEIAYNQAMGETDDLIQRMRSYSGSNDAARAVMADVWAQRHNVPFLTSTFETVEEMKGPRAAALPPPLPK